MVKSCNDQLWHLIIAAVVKHNSLFPRVIMQIANSGHSVGSLKHFPWLSLIFTFYWLLGAHTFPGVKTFMQLFSSVPNFWEGWSTTCQFSQVFIARVERRRKNCIFPTLEPTLCMTFWIGLWKRWTEICNRQMLEIFKHLTQFGSEILCIQQR